MSPEQIHNIKLELAKLEAEWKAHGDSSIDFRKDVKASMAIIRSEIRELTEALHAYMMDGSERKDGCFQKAKTYTNEKVAWAIAIPVTLMVLIKLFDVFHN